MYGRAISGWGLVIRREYGGDVFMQVHKREVYLARRLTWLQMHESSTLILGLIWIISAGLLCKCASRVIGW